MGKLAGKTVGLVGKHGYNNSEIPIFTEMIKVGGGTVVDLATTMPDYLFVGEGRGGKPPADVAKILKKAPSIEVVEGVAILQMLVPDRATFLRELAKETRAHTDVFWNNLDWICARAGMKIDLASLDLRDAHLVDANLKNADLRGANLHGAKAMRASFHDLNGVNLDRIDGDLCTFQVLRDCTFRQANLVNIFVLADPENCAFEDANLRKANLQYRKLIDCNFSGADLSVAYMERAEFLNANLTGANLSVVNAKGATFAGAIFYRANLEKANLTEANLQGADLRNANFREAVLVDADLTGANIEGACFVDAQLRGAKLDGLDLSRAEFSLPTAPRLIGANLTAFATFAGDLKHLDTSVEVELDRNEFAKVSITKEASFYHLSRWSHYGDGSYSADAHEGLHVPSIAQAMIDLAERWPKGTVRLDTLSASCQPVPRGKKKEEFRQLALMAWAEAFGLPDLTPAGVQKFVDTQTKANADLRQELLAELAGGEVGVEKWNARALRERHNIGALRNLDFKGARLDGVNFEDTDLEGSSFEGASLQRASFQRAKCAGVNFTDANLTESRLHSSLFDGSNLTGANLTRCDCASTSFGGANLSQANLEGAAFRYVNLQAADFSEANLEGTQFIGGTYNPSTKLPREFVSASSWNFIPILEPIPDAPTEAPEVGSLDFASFVEQIQKKIEQGRIDKAWSMLKSERFELFTDVTSDALMGVVKSQSSSDLVYSCRLSSDGAYSCCTQNLKPCGGLRGSLCKHLLVLILGLARAGKLDPATVNHWVDLSRSQKAAIDKDLMSTTFLRYKGAEAGEVDWRPTETIPEDFYAM